MTKQQILDEIALEITNNGLQKINGLILNTILTAMTDIIPEDEMLTSSFGGSVIPSSNIVVTPGHQKWFFAGPGTYPNAGNLSLPTGTLNILSYNGTSWEKLSIDLPVSTAKQIYDPNDNINAATMKAASDRWDKTKVVLQSFVDPTGLTDWADKSWPAGETANAFLNTGMGGVSNPYAAYGDIKGADLAGVGKLRIISSGLGNYGSGVAWWIGVRPDGSFQVLRSGVITSGSAEITVDNQFLYYRYSKPLGSTLQKQSIVSLPVEVDSVLKAIKAMGSGYSGELDLSTLGLKESNTAAQNTSIINQAIEDNPMKIIRVPSGYFKVNEIILKPGTEIKGAGVLRTVLYTDVGSTARFIIGATQGGGARGCISHIQIDARNTTEGGILIVNTFDHQIDQCVVFSNALYGIKHVGGLYHSIANVYFDGSDFGIITQHLTGMATNLIKYDRLYMVKNKKKCVQLNGGSNYVFNSCNFEDSGVSGDESTGGVHAIGLSPNGEGVDVVLNNCWSEGIRGGFILKVENCLGNSVIRDCMFGNGGNGGTGITNAIVNLNSRLEITGATRFSDGSFASFPTTVRAVNGFTFVSSPHINIGTNTVGTIKVVQTS